MIILIIKQDGCKVMENRVEVDRGNFMVMIIRLENAYREQVTESLALLQEVQELRYNIARAEFENMRVRFFTYESGALGYEMSSKENAGFR